MFSKLENVEITGIGKSELLILSESIRMLVENSKLRLSKSEISVTVSLGATMFNKNETLDEISFL